MGIKLSTQGILTNSQKKGLSKQDQVKLYEKLRKLDINKPILKAVAEAKSKRDEAAKKRRSDAADKIAEDAAAQNDSSTTSKGKKN